MIRRFQTAAVLIAALALNGCSEDPEIPTDPDPPTAIESTIEGTVNPNGAQSFVFNVTRIGSVTAVITALDPNTTIGLSLGTFTTNACQILLANDAATLNTTLRGEATTIGQFCIRLYDVGAFTEDVDFTVQLTHF